METLNPSSVRGPTLKLMRSRWSPLPRERMRHEAVNLSSVRGPTMQTGEGWLVPAPRLELGTGSSENIVRLQCITQVALDELERGTTRHAKAILATLKEVLSGC